MADHDSTAPSPPNVLQGPWGRPAPGRQLDTPDEKSREGMRLDPGRSCAAVAGLPGDPFQDARRGVPPGGEEPETRRW